MTQPATTVQPSPQLPRELFLELFRTISAVQCFWFSRKRPPVAGQRPNTENAWIDLTLTTAGSYGVDELRQQYNAQKDRNDNLLVGQRNCTIQVKARSFLADLEGYDLCERVRFRLRTQVARAIMVPVVSLRDIQPTIILPDEKSGDGTRLLSVAVMDVRFNYVVAADPNDPGEGDYIKSVNGGGNIPGTLLP